MKMKTKQEQEVATFQIQDMLPIALTLIVVGIGTAYGLSVMSDVRDDLGEQNCEDRTDSYTSFNETVLKCQNSTGDTIAVGTEEFNATESGMEGVAKLPEKLPLIATVIVAAIIIGILVRYLFIQFK